MIVNAQGVTVWRYDGGESTCPDCSAPLVAKRGEIVVWHWAHHASQHERCGGLWQESKWHLRWKAVYESWPGWRIEYKSSQTALYRYDACNPRTGKVREFVHSLSDKYKIKHCMLRELGVDILWIFDGKEFGSLRAVQTQDGEGVRKLLRPLAHLVASELGGNVLVHAYGKLWKEWAGNVWYQCKGSAIEALLKRYREVSVCG